MENLRLILLIAASFSIFFGYLRFISDDNGNVDLNNYRFTGGLGLVIGGMVEGTRDIFTLDKTSNSLSALAVYGGILLFYIGFSL